MELSAQWTSSSTRSSPWSRAQSSRRATTDSKRRSFACAASAEVDVGRPSAELREQLPQLRGHGSQSRTHNLEILLAEVVAQRFHERQVGQRKLRVGAASPENVAAQLPCTSSQFRREPGLSYPGLACQENEAGLRPG